MFLVNKLLEAQLSISLQVYYERGQKVIDCLSQGNFERAFKILRLRKAAFHNFRMAEGLLFAKKGGAALNQNESWLQLYRKIDEQDSRIMKCIQSEADHSVRELRNILNEKEKIIKFKAVKNKESTFQKSV